MYTSLRPLQRGFYFAGKEGFKTCPDAKVPLDPGRKPGFLK
jgi:hypothetical protein